MSGGPTYRRGRRAAFAYFRQSAIGRGLPPPAPYNGADLCEEWQRGFESVRAELRSGKRLRWLKRKTVTQV